MLTANSKPVKQSNRGRNLYYPVVLKDMRVYVLGATGYSKLSECRAAAKEMLDYQLGLIEVKNHAMLPLATLVETSRYRSNQVQ